MEILFGVQVPARLESLGALVSSVSDCARVLGFDQQKISAIELAVEEALVNIFNHAYPKRPGDVQVRCKRDQGLLVIEIIDSGIPFDATAFSDPDLTADISARREGGLGIFLMKRMVDEVRYRRAARCNILELVVRKEPRRGEEP
jgi:anti-sigma regulatory factor (Ser/Thr protein kinase)